MWRRYSDAEIARRDRKWKRDRWDPRELLLQTILSFAIGCLFAVFEGATSEFLVLAAKVVLPICFLCLYVRRWYRFDQVARKRCICPKCFRTQDETSAMTCDCGGALEPLSQWTWEEEVKPRSHSVRQLAPSEEPPIDTAAEHRALVEPAGAPTRSTQPSHRIDARTQRPAPSPALGLTGARPYFLNLQSPPYDRYLFGIENGYFTVLTGRRPASTETKIPLSQLSPEFERQRVRYPRQALNHFATGMLVVLVLCLLFPELAHVAQLIEAPILPALVIILATMFVVGRFSQALLCLMARDAVLCRTNDGKVVATFFLLERQTAEVEWFLAKLLEAMERDNTTPVTVGIGAARKEPHA